MTRVLLVEDNRGDARLLGEHLREAFGSGFEITHAETLADAIQKLGNHDVVLLDLSLPDAIGLETVTRMIAAARTIPIIVLTGNRDDRTAVDAVGAGAQDYVLKDECSGPLLTKTIRYAIERKKAELLEIERAKTSESLSRARFIADVTGAASASLDLTDSLRAVARMLVPTLGDLCTIDLPRDGGKRLERIAWEGSDPRYLAVLQELADRDPLGPAHPQSVVLQAVAERRTVIVTADELAERARDARHRELLVRLDLRAVMVTPLFARDRVVAAISYGAGASRRPYGADEQVLAEEVASRVALAIDNVRLFADAQRAIRARDELIAIVSHDLRNPLGVLDLALELLARDPARLPDAISRMQRATDRMQSLIAELLDISRIDAGTLTVAPAPVELASVLADAIEQHRVLATEKGLRLVGDFQTPLGTVHVDRDRLQQVLANLIGNALKVTPRDGTITVDANLGGERATIAVRDTGPGIAPEHVEHIFDRFWQAPDRRRDGLGLGLAIVKGIVDAHHGTIAVDSQLGRGTSFKITLPVRA